MNLAHALPILTEAAALLTEASIPWMLDAGSVLGLVRDSFSDAWLQHDTDHDFLVLGGQQEKEVILTAFLAAGYRILREYDRFNRPTQLCLHKHGIWVDMYFWLENHAEHGMLITETEHGQLTCWKRFWDHRSSHLHQGVEYVLPGPAAEYLQFRFGPDWRTPHKSKQPWEKNCPALRKHPVR